MANDGSIDDVISFDDLMPPSAQPPPAAPETEGEAAEAGATPKPGPAPDAVDALLATEDPAFAATMDKLKSEASQAEVPAADIDSLDLQALSHQKFGKIRVLYWMIRRPVVRYATGLVAIVRRVFMGLRRLRPLIKEGAQKAGHLAKDGGKKALKWISGKITIYRGLPILSKIIVVFAGFLGLLALIVLKLSLGGYLSFHVGPEFLLSFADVADAKYTIKEDEPFEDFTDPLFHPEHVVSFDKIIVNLRRHSDGSLPMGYFAFYFEASNQESAVELRDRQAEARDLVVRTLEQMSHGELVTVTGKEKMKIMLRRNLNSMLTRGQVRRVFIKNMVVKE